MAQTKTPQRTPSKTTQTKQPPTIDVNANDKGPSASEGKIDIAQPQSLANVPDYLKEYVGSHEGLEKTDQSDVVIPRLVLAQSNTPQLKKTDPNYIKGLEQGVYFNSVTGKIYGEKVMVVPLIFSKYRIKFLQPLGSGIDCQSLNGVDGGRLAKLCRACEHAQFGDEGKPACTEFKGFVSFLPEHREIVATAGKSTSLKAFKQWVTKIKMSNLPAYAKFYSFGVTTDKKQGNEFYQYVITDGDFTPKEFFAQAKAYFDGLKDRDIVVDNTGATDDEGDGNTPF